MLKGKMTEREHIIPVFYLKNFTDQKGLLHVYDYEEQRKFAVRPANFCCVNNIYETPFEQATPEKGRYILPNNIENEFSKQESVYAKLVNNIISRCESNGVPSRNILYKNEKDTLYDFIINLALRSPENIRKAQRQLSPKTLKSSYEYRFLQELLLRKGFGKADRFVELCLKQIFLLPQNESFPMYCRQKFSEVDAHFYYAGSEEFITWSRPVIMSRNYEGENTDSCNATLILTPKIMVLLSNQDKFNDGIDGIQVLEEKSVHYLNQKMMEMANAQGQAIIANSENLIDQYARD